MKYKIVVVFCVALGLISCDKNPYIRDVEDIKVEFSIQPFYQDILDLSEHFSEQKRVRMQKKYGYFFESYNARVMKLGLSTDTAYAKKLYDFLHEDWVLELYKQTNNVFKDSTNLYHSLHSGLQYYKYYFPQKSIPNICSFIGAVQYSIVLDSNMVGIGLDKYLGKDYAMYQDMEISTFVKRNMNTEKIPSDFMRAIAESEFPKPFTEEYLLSQMLQQGRYMYFVKCMLPEEPDSLLWGYTTRQLEFCEKSEGEFWKYFVSTENMLFSSDYMMAKRFIDDGPFTPVFTKESPGKIGQWIGFKIVESFMKQNPKVTLEELFSIESSQEIMRKAKYNP